MESPIESYNWLEFSSIWSKIIKRASTILKNNIFVDVSAQLSIIRIYQNIRIKLIYPKRFIWIIKYKLKTNTER